MFEERWFSYPIWSNIVSYEHHEELLKYCLLRKAYDDGKSFSNRGGWHSSDLDFHTDDVINRFSKFIQYHLNILSEKIKVKLVINNLWININGYQTRNDTHTHPGAFISGVFYVKAEENQGDICFENPLRYFNQFMYDDPIFLDRHVCHKPRTGKLLLFPSSLPHSVLSNETNIDRISISFNTIIA